MQITLKNLKDIKPYDKNPRKNEKAVEACVKSIEEFGSQSPIIIDKDNVIICGHTRWKASKRLKLKQVPCIIADELSEEQVKAYRLADNKVGEIAEWDFDLLGMELSNIFDIDMSAFGFDIDTNSVGEMGVYDDYVLGSLRDKYIAPPFSVIRGDLNSWIERKRVWGKYIHSEDGRDPNLIGKQLATLAKRQQTFSRPEKASVSIFDPVLMETMLAWFCPNNAKVIDCFSGGSVRGLVSAFTGRDYVGMDLRQEQIDANEINYNELRDMKDFNGNTLKHPTWICGDSATIDRVIDDKFDFMITCPPYADLEVYSNDERDISNMEYPKFCEVYRDIIKKTVGLLKDNAFAVVVVGEVRSKKGDYYNFVGDTIKAFVDSGMKYYNEIIFTSPVGTGALRANTIFGKYRKVVKLHQNVLVFLKGDEKKIELGEYNYEFPNYEDINNSK